MKQIKNQKKREALLRYWHGDNWTEEDQKVFERERNRRQCLNHRNKHRDDYTNYQRSYQQKYREEHKYHYGLIQWNKNHPDDQMTLEQYINYRKNKERMKEQKDVQGR